MYTGHMAEVIMLTIPRIIFYSEFPVILHYAPILISCIILKIILEVMVKTNDASTVYVPWQNYLIDRDQSILLLFRPQPIMLKILPFMLLSSAQKNCPLAKLCSILCS